MPALIFDLDGTLVDTVYAHVFAWQRALNERGLDIDGWRIHRRIGMSGGLFTRAVARELGRELTEQETAEVQDRHGELFRTLLPDRRALPGAVELLADLRALGTCTASRPRAGGRRSTAPWRCSASPPRWSSSSAVTSCGRSPSRTCSSPAPSASGCTPTSAT